jgi:hypothetical protein
MLEDDLTAVAERVAVPPRPDLPEAVLARLDEPSRSHRRWTAAVAAVAAVVATLALSPQVRAFAVDLLDVAGIEISGDEPDSSPVPQQPLPSSRLSDLEQAAEEAAFPLSVPAALGDPDRVTVVDQGRVVSMTWRDGTVVLDQFDGTLGPVFSKQIGDLDVVLEDVAGDVGAWIPGSHDVMYVDRDGEVVIATARLAGRTLIWGDGDVTYRLEGADLTRREALTIARSLTGTS